MLNLSVDRSSGVPVGAQLTSRLRSAIERGELRPDERLPSLREAADAAAVNVNTIRAVYAKLEAAGLVATEQGRGTFVTARAADADAPAARRRLHEEIARLEAELVSLPLRPSEPGAERPPAGRARMLSLEELQAVRDVLAERVDDVRTARGEIVRRLESEKFSPSASGAASRRSSTSRAGARIRWRLGS